MIMSDSNKHSDGSNTEALLSARDHGERTTISSLVRAYRRYIAPCVESDSEGIGSRVR